MMERSCGKRVSYNVATIATLGRHEDVLRLTKKTQNALFMTGDKKTKMSKGSLTNMSERT